MEQQTSSDQENLAKKTLQEETTQPNTDENEKEKQSSDDEQENEDSNLSEKDKMINKKLDDFYNDYYLSDFQKFAVAKFMRENVATGKPQVARIREWIMNKLNGQNKASNCPAQQRGCPEIMPGLRALPFWDSSNLPWIQQVQDKFDVIKQELLSLRNQKGFQPYRGPSWTSEIKPKDGVGRKSNDSGDWNVFYLFFHNIKFEENCKKVPQTIEIIESIFPKHYHHAFFSAVTPGTHIMKHHGPTNKKLRFHMPIMGVKNSRLRAGDIIMNQEEGKCYVFDDSFEHEAWHDGDETRIVLIVDIWHPDLTVEEVKFLSLLQNAKMRTEKIISEQDAANDNFYRIIEMSRDLLDSNDWWSTSNKETIEQFTQQQTIQS